MCKPPATLPILGPSELNEDNSFYSVHEVFLNHIRTWIQYFQDAGDPAMRERTVCAGFLGEPTLPVTLIADGSRYLFFGTETLVRVIAFSQIEIDSWPLTVLLAHEFGHVLQDVHRFRFSAASAGRREGHADCIGGFLTGLARGFFGPGDDPEWTDRLEEDPDLWLHEDSSSTDSVERRQSFDEGISLASISMMDGEAGLTSGEVLASCYHRQTPFRIERKMESTP